MLFNLDRLFNQFKRDHGLRRSADRFLFITALIVFAALVLFRRGTPKIMEARVEVLVFAQWWQDELEPGALESIAGEFEKLNPGVRIKLQNLSYTGMRRMLGGDEDVFSSADIIALDPLWLPDIAGEERLAPLAGADTDGGLPGGVYADRALPLVSFMIPLFYNIDVLRSAGFSRPPRNRSELLEISRALAGEGRFGLGLALGPEDVLGLYRGVFPWFWAAGTALVQEGGPAFSGRAFTETLDFLAQLYREGLIPPDAFSKTGEQRLDDFVRGRSAMMTASIRDIGLLRERFLAAAGEGPDRFGITAVPGPDAYAGKPVFGLTSWYAGLSAQSDHPEEGRAFLAFLGERAPLLAAAAHAVPGSAASGPPGAGPDHAAEDPLYSKAWDMSEAGEMAREFYGLPRFEERALLFRGELQKLFEGRQSSAETAAAIQQGWERLGG